MSKAQKSQNNGGSNVIELGKVVCCAQGCNKKQTRAEFCEEHFTWYKEGLISGKGERPSDFDKKFIAFQQRSRKKAA